MNIEFRTYVEDKLWDKGWNGYQRKTYLFYYIDQDILLGAFIEPSTKNVVKAYLLLFRYSELEIIVITLSNCSLNCSIQNFPI